MGKDYPVWEAERQNNFLKAKRSLEQKPPSQSTQTRSLSKDIKAERGWRNNDHILASFVENITLCF